MRDWILCRITSSRPGRTGNIAIGRQDLQTGRLPSNSSARPGRLFTVNESVFGPFLGRLETGKLNEVMADVRNLF